MCFGKGWGDAYRAQSAGAPDGQLSLKVSRLAAGEMPRVLRSFGVWFSIYKSICEFVYFLDLW